MIVPPLLGLVNQDQSIGKEINVYYIVSLHIWMMFIEAFVYLCSIEYAIAISWAYMINDKKNHAKKWQQV